MSSVAEWKSLLDLLATFRGKHRELLLHHDGYRTRTCSADDVWLAAHAGAKALREAGVRSGDNVVIWSENRPEWVFAFWACLLLDAVVVPIDSRSSPAFIARVAQQVQPRLTLLGDDVPPVDAPSLRLTALDWHRAAEPAALPTPDATRNVEIVFTSGSTGDPKGVVITHANLLANLAAMDTLLLRYHRFVRLLSPVRLVNLLPFSHLFGQQFGLFLPALVDVSSVLVHTVHPPALAALIRRFRAAALVATPRLLELLETYVRGQFPAPPPTGHWAVRWLRSLPVHRHFGWRFCLLIAGAAALDTERQRFWRGMSFVVTQGYGLTETSPIVSFDDPLASQSGTVGHPLPGVELRVAADGEILLRGPSIFTGYYRAPERTAAVFDADGWFHTGDLGSLGPDGRLTVRGRKKDLIALPSGEKVFPDDVEHVLTRLPGVQDAAVIGPDRVHAVLILSPSSDPEQIIRQANASLEPHQKITQWSLWPGPELPRTDATRKLKRHEIAQNLAAPAPVPTSLQALRRLAPGKTLEDAGLTSLDRVELAMQLGEDGASEIAWQPGSTVADVLAQESQAAETAVFPRWNRSLWARAIRFLGLQILVFPCVRLLARRRVLAPTAAPTGPVIIAANHQSHLDVPLILLSLPPTLRYRVAPAMWKERFAAFYHPEQFSWTRRLSHTIQYLLAALFFNGFPMPQTEAGAAQSLRYAGELADAGWSILIFPEGERTPDGAIHRFFPGVAVLATRLGLPVLPVRIDGAFQILRRHSRVPHPGPVTLRFDPPSALTGSGKEEMADELRARIDRPLPLAPGLLNE